MSKALKKLPQCSSVDGQPKMETPPKQRFVPRHSAGFSRI